MEEENDLLPYHFENGYALLIDNYDELIEQAEKELEEQEKEK